MAARTGVRALPFISCAEAARHSLAPASPDEEFSVSGSCMSKHLQYPDTEAIPEDLNADG